MSKNPVRWVLLYWMPYNHNSDRVALQDLAQFESPIIEMISRGIVTESVTVVVQSEAPGRDGMLRTTLQHRGMRTQTVVDGQGSSAAALRSFFRWARVRFDAARWGIVILGHADRVDEFCPTALSGAEEAASLRWMNIDGAAQAIAHTWESPIELLFLQNCCKGTLESHYSFESCASFTLSSQAPLGAPNYYYEQAFRRLSSTDLDGAGLAAAIMEAEREDMYTTLAVTRNDLLVDLTAVLNKLIDSIAAASPGALRAADLPLYDYGTERLADARKFFAAAVRTSRAGRETLEPFHELYSRLIERFQSTLPEPHGFSGLSVLVPATVRQLNRYRPLKFYRVVRMAKLFESSGLLRRETGGDETAFSSLTPRR